MGFGWVIGYPLIEHLRKGFGIWDLGFGIGDVGMFEKEARIRGLVSVGS